MKYISYCLFCASALIGAVLTTKAQVSTISLDECQRLARSNYPVIQKLNLIARSSNFELENANKRFLPQLSVSGQASYQSETLSFSDALPALPGTVLPGISKDQYKIQAEINQLIYDGGNTAYQKSLTRANAALQEQNIQVILYTIRQRVNNLYFSVLLMDAQEKQNELNKASLQTQVEKAEAAFKNGVALRSDVDELKAEIVNIEMAGVEFRSNKLAFLKMLAAFIGQALDESTRFEIPADDNGSVDMSRPELKAFELQEAVIDMQLNQFKAEMKPQVSAFFQGAYGRPTLNIIENKFGPWYIGGIRFSWSLGSLYTLSNRKAILNLNRQGSIADKQTFLLNTGLDLVQQDEQVAKFLALTRQDENIIALRTSVTKSAEAQLANGVITTHEYIQKTNAENLARQTMILHQIQLLHAKYNRKYIAGN